MPEWGAGAWPCPRAQKLSPLPTTRGKGLTGHLARLGAWPRASRRSGPEAAGEAEGEPGQLQRSQHLGAVLGSCRGIVCRRKLPRPLQGTAGELLLVARGAAPGRTGSGRAGLRSCFPQPGRAVRLRPTLPGFSGSWAVRWPLTHPLIPPLCPQGLFISSRGAVSSASWSAFQVLS